jgi:hypothetical protein
MVWALLNRTCVAGFTFCAFPGGPKSPVVSIHRLAAARAIVSPKDLTAANASLLLQAYLSDVPGESAQQVGSL